MILKRRENGRKVQKVISPRFRSVCERGGYGETEEVFVLDVFDDGDCVESCPFETLPAEEDEADETNESFSRPDSHTGPQPGAIGAVKDLDVTVTVNRARVVGETEHTLHCDGRLTRTWSRGKSWPVRYERPRIPRTTFL